VVTAPAVDRVARRAVDKYAARRDELAQAALVTLAELGYARTSLREIAQNSAFSHGVLHYYFADKVDLITHCVRLYKTQCVRRYDDVVASAATAQQLREDFAAAVAGTLVQDTGMHRLWYDLRTQSMFEPSLRPDVTEIDAQLEAMIWRVVRRYAELSGVEATVRPALAYATLDGVFQLALVAYASGDSAAGSRVRDDVATVLSQLVPATP
jgi:AcrR family transcriptional regulator